MHDFHESGPVGQEDGVCKARACHSDQQISGSRKSQLLTRSQTLHLHRPDTKMRVARAQCGYELRLVGDLAADDCGRVADVCDVVFATDE